jgi:hypothetical protein
MQTSNEHSFRSNVKDISLQLIFCFLNLVELPIIAQCNKRWYRLVTDKLFFNMYQNNKVMSISNQCDISLLSSSKFRDILRDVCFENYAISKCNLELIPQLTKLHSVEFTINLDQTYDFVSSFRLFPSSLRILRLYIKTNSLINNVHIALQKLFDAVSLITQIEELKLVEDLNNINDFPFLSYLVNLERLALYTGYFDRTVRNSLITAIRSLPKIKQLIMDDNWFTRNNLDFLRQLCAQPHAPSCLRSLPTFCDIESDLQDEFVNLLKELPSLKGIQYVCTGEYSLSKSLAQFLCGFSISKHVFNDSEIDSLISMTQLIEILLDECSMTEAQFKRLFQAIGNKLLYLSIFKLKIKSQDLFHALSNCSQLKQLSISLDSDFHSSCSFYLFKLGKCTLLEKLSIFFTSDIMSSKSTTLKYLFKSVLSLPSDLIPSLKNVEITIC